MFGCEERWKLKNHILIKEDMFSRPKGPLANKRHRTHISKTDDNAHTMSHQFIISQTHHININ